MVMMIIKQTCKQMHYTKNPVILVKREKKQNYGKKGKLKKNDNFILNIKLESNKMKRHN